MESPLVLVYWDDSHFWSAALSIILTPIYWMLVSHLELRTHILRRVFCSRHIAVCIFALTVISLSLNRNWKFLLALKHQPKWGLLQENIILWFGHTLVVIGFFLVLRTMLALGFIATYMGDYFGLYLRKRVTSFPYSWMTHPMYTGAFMLFLGMALIHASQAGLVLASIAGIMYLIAASLEETYTDRFYVSYPKGTRTVGVQVSCQTSIVEIKARTVSTQTGGDVDVIEDDMIQGLVDIVDEEDDEMLQAAAATRGSDTAGVQEISTQKDENRNNKNDKEIEVEQKGQGDNHKNQAVTKKKKNRPNQVESDLKQDTQVSKPDLLEPKCDHVEPKQDILKSEQNEPASGENIENIEHKSPNQEEKDKLNSDQIESTQNTDEPDHHLDTEPDKLDAAAGGIIENDDISQTTTESPQKPETDHLSVSPPKAAGHKVSPGRKRTGKHKRK